MEGEVIVDYDEALRIVGGYRPYHLTLFFLVGIGMWIAVSYQDLNIVFIGYEPPHHCRIHGNQTLNETIPYTMKDGVMVYDKCRMYQDFPLDNTTQPCTNGWDFQSDGYETVVTEWDLVCENNYLVETSQVIYQICMLVAELCLAYLIDRYGRKPMHVIASVMVAVTGTTIAFSVNYPMFVAMRCITAFAVSGALSSGITIIMELFDSEKRDFAGIGLEYSWLIAYVPMSLFAWLIKDWRYLQLALSLIMAVFIIYIWVLPESVPWLTATGKIRKAEMVLAQMARWNKVKLKQPILLSARKPSLIQGSDKKNPPDWTGSMTSNLSTTADMRDVSIRDVMELFTNRILRKHTIISAMISFANHVVYYILILISPSLPGNRFFNFFILAVVEIPTYFITLIIVRKFGRRLPLCFFHILAAFPLIIMAFLPSATATGFSLVWLSNTLMVIAKFAISASFAIMILFLKELFPTKLRATSGGVCNVVGKSGNIVAPMVSYAAKTNFPWLPGVLSAVVSVIVGLLTLLLPETRGKALPQTTEEVRHLYDKPAESKLRIISKPDSKDEMKSLNT